jgi:hypothetical protein
MGNVSRLTIIPPAIRRAFTALTQSSPKTSFNPLYEIHDNDGDHDNVEDDVKHPSLRYLKPYPNTILTREG